MCTHMHKYQQYMQWTMPSWICSSLAMPLKKCNIFSVDPN
uniref:Uncharacterized protein n=1 Tax=Anguilla anguilla TaxID=7936 RepID=A0A0E9WPM5_ANGAN